MGAQLVADYLMEEGPVPPDSDLLFCLFMVISGGIDWKDAADPLLNAKLYIALVIFLGYVGLMVLCIMNALLGIFCQCAIDTAASDQEAVIQLQLMEKARFVET